MAFLCLCLEPGRAAQEWSLHPVRDEQPRTAASTVVAPPARRLVCLQVWRQHQHLPPVLPGGIPEKEDLPSAGI